MSMRARLFAAVVLGGGGCSSDDMLELPAVVWSGKHLDYAPQPGADAVCAGTLPYMDRYVELAGAAMEIEIGRTLYVHGSGEEDDPFCDHVAGCLEAGHVVHSIMAPHEHELVHAARSFAGRPMAFFEEGAAEMFGGDNRRNIAPALGPLREGFGAAPAGASLPAAWYPRAGHFSAYLHQSHGPEVTRALMLHTNESTTSEQAVALLEQATGVPFEELEEDYESAGPFCSEPHAYRYPLHPCDAPEALRQRCDGAKTVPIVESMACDDAGVLGPRDGQVFKYVAFDVPADGDYLISAGPDQGGGRIDIKACHMGCIPPPVSLPFGDPSEQPASLVWLRAGRYAMRLSRNADVDGLSPTTITIRGADCG